VPFQLTLRIDTAVPRIDIHELHSTCHDQSWNLVPAEPAANPSKSDSLPARQYLDPLIQLQTKALATAAELRSRRWPRWAKPLEDYESDLKLSPRDFGDRSRVQASLRPTIEPLLSIEEQSGFPSGWKWRAAAAT
jgi:hypothetical protein